MSGGQVALLGAIAGFTIFLGLPVGRWRAAMPGTRTVLNAIAIGVLLFLFWDILAHAWEPIDGALAGRRFGPAVGEGVVMAAGFALGLVGLVWFDRWVAARPAPARSEGEPNPLDADRPRSLWASPAGRLAVLIAVGIGLHNFAEGLAIGNSAATGALPLAWLLVIGFATHNATEGFGIVAPLAAEQVRPTWTQLAALGLVGGAPTLVGTLVGQRFTSEVIGVAFLSVAAGSILYVIIELFAVARKTSLKYFTTWGLLAGLILGFVTDGILIAAGS